MFPNIYGKSTERGFPRLPVMMGLSVLSVCMLLVGYTAALGTLQKILLIIFGWIIFLVSVSVAIFLDREAGSYECSH